MCLNNSNQCAKDACLCIAPAGSQDWSHSQDQSNPGLQIPDQQILYPISSYAGAASMDF